MSKPLPLMSKFLPLTYLQHRHALHIGMSRQGLTAYAAQHWSMIASLPYSGTALIILDMCALS